jgi:hypothetical protein
LFIVTTCEPKALALRYPSSSTPYQKFVASPPKSFFKALFLGTELGKALQKLSASKAVPKGLKNKECKKGNQKTRPPIPYVPIINLPDKTEFSVPIWDTETQKAFLIHVQQAKCTCKRKGLFKDYEDALEAESKSDEQAKSLQRANISSLAPMTALAQLLQLSPS